jgi:hypothetical protein
MYFTGSDGIIYMTFIRAWLIIGFYSMACAGLGSLAYQLINILLQNRESTIHPGSTKQNTIVKYSIDTIVGVSLFGIIWTLIALRGQLSPAVIFGILIPFFLYNCWNLGHNWKFLAENIRQIASAIWHVGWLYKLICLGSLYSIIVIISNQYMVFPGDASAYYFALAKVIASSHTLKLLPGYYFGKFPSEAMMDLGLNGELHFAAVFSLGANHYARYLDIVLLITGIIVYLKFLSIAGIKIRGLLIAMLVVLLSTSVTNVTATGKVDLYGITFTLGAIYFAGLYFFESSNRNNLIFCGILIGTAITTKSSYLINMLPSIVLLLVWNTIIIRLVKDRRQFLENIRQHSRSFFSVAIILLGAILGSMISYFIKNQVLLGFFLRPFFLPKNILQAITILFPQNTVIKMVFTFPFTLSFFDIPSNPGNFPPILLSLLPSLYFARKSIRLNSLSTASFTAGLLGVILWLIFFPGVPFVRYIFTTMLLLLPLVLYATEYTFDRVIISSLRIAVNGIILIATVFGLINPLFVDTRINLIAALVNREIPRCTFPQCEQDMAINKDASAGDRLLNLSDFRYWLRSDLIECSATSQETDEILSVPKDDFWETTYKLGIKYVSLNLPSKGLEDPGIWLIPEWLKIDKLYYNEGSGLIVYRLNSYSAPYLPVRQCIQSRPPAWTIIDNP